MELEQHFPDLILALLKCFSILKNKVAVDKSWEPAKLKYFSDSSDREQNINFGSAVQHCLRQKCSSVRDFKHAVRYRSMTQPANLKFRMNDKQGSEDQHSELRGGGIDSSCDTGHFISIMRKKTFSFPSQCLTFCV